MIDKAGLEQCERLVNMDHWSENNAGVAQARMGELLATMHEAFKVISLMIVLLDKIDREHLLEGALRQRVATLIGERDSSERIDALRNANGELLAEAVRIAGERAR